MLSKNKPQYDEVAQQAKQDIDTLRRIKRSIRQGDERTVVLSLSERDYYGSKVRSVFDQMDMVSKYSEIDRQTTRVEHMSRKNNTVWHVGTIVRNTFEDDQHTDTLRGDPALLVTMIDSIIENVLVPARQECLRVS
jgi:hypothetical protein